MMVIDAKTKKTKRKSESHHFLNGVVSMITTKTRTTTIAEEKRIDERTIAKTEQRTTKTTSIDRRAHV